LPVTRLAARIATALAPGADVRSGDPDSSAPGAEREQVLDLARSMDRWRSSRRQRSPAEALALFRAVKSSEYALLETIDHGSQRTVVALRRPGGTGLTPREAAVCQFAADGMSNKLIGAELGISASTVAVHLSAALRKLGCPNRAALVLRHRQSGLR
jgi:DNA-binding CsgD family transcriptional regulator